MQGRKQISIQFLNSWLSAQGRYSFDEILQWIQAANKHTRVNINKISLQQCAPWYYDEAEGIIRNPKGAFFSIAGLSPVGEGFEEQPIILQKEIGYLGILCKEIDGLLHFLMQAKIEPGNINKVQISPTIQATKSNFTRAHGGREPAYLEYFANASRHKIVVDQIQSEQSSRFLGKRNRNIILY